MIDSVACSVKVKQQVGHPDNLGASRETGKQIDDLLGGFFGMGATRCLNLMHQRRAVEEASPLSSVPWLGLEGAQE
jgi:hypothetical protein